MQFAVNIVLWAGILKAKFLRAAGNFSVAVGVVKELITITDNISYR
jgi:hypothetical protein